MKIDEIIVTRDSSTLNMIEVAGDSTLVMEDVCTRHLTQHHREGRALVLICSFLNGSDILS